MKILIVDDDAMILHLLQIYLGDQLGYDTVVVRSGAEALSQIRRHSFDLTLIDLNLPDMTGFQILEEIRLIEEAIALPVIVMTATKDVELEIKAFEMGANDFMRKPLEPRVIMARVRNLLRIADAFTIRTKVTEQTPSGNRAAEVVQKLEAQVGAKLGHADLEQDFSASSCVGAPTITVDSSSFYGSAAVEGPMVPCEIPVVLEYEGGSFFCKTLKIGSGSIMLLAFNDIPTLHSLQVKMVHPNGESFTVETVEKERRSVGQSALGATRLFLEVVDSPQLFVELCSELAHAYRFHGMNGLRNVLGGGNSTMPISTMPTPIIPKEPVDKPKEVFRYRFLKLLGKGGFASVFLVRDLALKRDVAMKVLTPRLAAEEGARDRFLGEAQIAAQFHHPNIVFVYAVGEYGREQLSQFMDFPKSVLAPYADHFIFFTMHYIEGRTAGDLLGPGKGLPVSQCLLVFSETLQALSFAHQKGVVHRDIKPGNIMIDAKGHVIVTDFGIASIGEDQAASSQDEAPLECTPRYASPEQLLSRPLDGRSDLYSLAMTVYHMLRGQPAFVDRELARLVARQLRSAPPPLIQYSPELKPEMEVVIMRCLSKNPDNRYANALEVLEALAKLETAHKDEATNERTLTVLLEKVLLLETEGDVVSLMDKLVGFLHLHQGPTKADLREQVAEPAVLDALLMRALREEHFDNLYQFFKALISSRAVHTLLRWFEKELWPVMKAFIARLAVVSARKDPKPLVVYCSELPDGNAVLMLRAFAEEGVLRHPGLTLHWAAHPGLQTRLELLRILRTRKNWNEEQRKTLDFLFQEGQPMVTEEARLLAKMRMG